MKINEHVILSLTQETETIAVWASSNTDVCTIEVAEGGGSAKVTAVGLGESEIVVRTNYDFGSGVREHRTLFNITVDGDDVPDPIVVKETKEEPSSPHWNAEPRVVNYLNP